MEEKSGAETGIIPFQEYDDPDFGIAYFEDNLDEFMDLIREENAADDPLLNFNPEIYDFDNLNADDDVLLMNTDCSAADEIQNDDVGEREKEEATSEKRKKSDKSTTLMSERRRRRRMKEKLYTLRSLVPNITKVLFIYVVISCHVLFRISTA